MIKSQVEATAGVQGEMCESFDVFPKEIEMYVKLLPEFEALLKELTGETIEFGPRLVF